VRSIVTAKLLLGSCVVFGAVSVLTMACGAGGSGRGSGLGGGNAGDGGRGAGAGMIASARADEAGTRLKPNAITGSDGSKHYLGTFRDGARNEDCSFTTLADGSLRCVPPTSPMKIVNAVYADAQCTQLLAQVATECAAPPKYLGVTDDCGRTTAVYAFGPAYSGAQIWLKDGSGHCMGYQASAGETYLVAGAPVDLTSFVAGTVGPE
jgi:hypothetical protein